MGVTGYRGNLNDMLRVECWCRSGIVQVFPSELRQGLTRPCSDKRCKALDAKNRAKVDPEAQ